MGFKGYSGVDMDFAGFSGVKRVLSVFFKVVKDFSSLLKDFSYLLKDLQRKKDKENFCHCLYHTSARKGHMVTHMYITYNPLSPIQGCSVKLCIHELLQADGSYPSEHHKPPTHLQFYCPIKSVELS